jgi:hypothetical protein
MVSRSTRRYFKGGDLDIQAIDPEKDEYLQQRNMYIKAPTLPTDYTPDAESELTQRLAQQQEQYSEKVKTDGLYPKVDPKLLQKMMDAGVPWTLAQHPNVYSANPNQVLNYRNRADFTDSQFYNKYESEITKVNEKKGYGKGQRQIIKGKPLRIVFASSSPDDNVQFYIDPKDDDEFINILNDAKESNILVPIEFLSKQFMEANKLKVSEQIQDNKRIWSAGYDYADRKWRDEINRERDEEEEQMREQQAQENNDDDSAWGGLKKGFEMGASIASLF